MKITSLFLFGTFLLGSISGVLPLAKKIAYTTDDWELVKEVEDIKVFTKSLDDSNLKEIKIEMWFRDASLSDIIAVTDNISAYKDWLYKCTHAETIKRINPQEKIDYFQIDFPWPMSDRDTYNQSKISQDSLTRKLTIESNPVDLFPEEDGFVRVRENRTRWYFFPKENGDIFLEYYLAPNPGGNIPDWLVNMVIERGPTKSMLQLKELVHQQKGKNPSYNWIK